MINCKLIIFLLQVMLYLEERREKIIDFIANLFGIIGGVITVLGYVFFSIPSHDLYEILISYNGF